jgi:hypothetical protein
VLALAEGTGFGPEVKDSDIRAAFGAGWEIEDISRTHYVAIATAEHHINELGFERGQRVELPAWLARIRRV